jgi:hypothetical protein
MALAGRSVAPREVAARAAIAPPTGVPAMAKKPTARTEFVLFDIVYEDGSQRSNRKVDASVLGGLDGDEAARTAIMEQDQAIAERSGLPPLQIKSIKRSGK